MRLAPPLVQLALLVMVARRGSFDDVGSLALASAVSFLCGALAEAGFSTTLSIPRVAFGVDAPPLRATAPHRLAVAAAGSCLYTLLWAAGLGHHDPVFLLVAPLPFALALAVGYAGVMNASGALRLEGIVSLAESVLVVVLALVLVFLLPALIGALIGLTVGRAAGTAARALLIRRLPQSDARPPRGVVRVQYGFFLLTAAIVFQGQADMVVIGFAGTLATAAVYGPLVRTAASALLLTESLTWGLYGAAHPQERGDVSWVGRHWQLLTLCLSVVSAAVFVALAQPFLEFVVDRQLPDLSAAVALLGVMMVARGAALVLNVSIVRAGRQREELPYVVLAGVVLAVAAAFAAHAHSLTGLAAARLGSEALIAAAFFWLSLRPSLRKRDTGRSLEAPS